MVAKCGYPNFNRGSHDRSVPPVALLDLGHDLGADRLDLLFGQGLARAAAA